MSDVEINGYTRGLHLLKEIKTLKINPLACNILRENIREYQKERYPNTAIKHLPVQPGAEISTALIILESLFLTLIEIGRLLNSSDEQLIELIQQARHKESLESLESEAIKSTTRPPITTIRHGKKGKKEKEEIS